MAAEAQVRPGQQRRLRLFGAAEDLSWRTAASSSYSGGSLRYSKVAGATVSLHAATRASRRIVYTASWGSQATHTIRIVVVGTVGHPRVESDAFVRLVRS